MNERQRFLDTLDVKFYFWSTVIICLVVSMSVCSRIPAPIEQQPASQDP